MTRVVLVVDDDEDVRELITMSMSDVGGWTVLEASSGREAIEIAALHRPTAIMLDVTMPGFDGIATFTALQERPETAAIPVVLLTASQRVGPQAWDGLALTGVLTKPFDPLTLPARIDALLASRPAVA